MQAGSRPIEILLVEDSPGDVRLTEEALRSAKVKSHLVEARDGESALDILRHRGNYAASAQPALVLLDLRLPGMDGRQVLKEIKSDPSLCHIPVVVLTKSEDKEDIMNAYEEQANCFITKPVQVKNLVEVVKLLEGFWLTIVALPESEAGDAF